MSKKGGSPEKGERELVQAVQEAIQRRNAVSTKK